MKVYTDLLQAILDKGTRQQNRTGIPAISLPGAMMQFDLRQGFPAVTVKKLYFKSVIAELVGFIKGYDNAADFRALGCRIWDANANENTAWLKNPNRLGTDDLGRIYGVQWRRWRGSPRLVESSAVDPGHTGKGEEQIAHYHDSNNRGVVAVADHVDQLLNAVETILRDPTNRRIIINAWRPDEFDQMALPPCHVMYQFIVDTSNNVLNLCMYQRSADMALGVPYNIASCAALLTFVAALTGYTPGTFTHFLADAHVYENHVDGVREMIAREPYPLPTLKYTGVRAVEGQLLCLDIALNSVRPDMFELVGYNHHPEIPFQMAV